MQPDFGEPGLPQPLMGVMSFYKAAELNR